MRRYCLHPSVGLLLFLATLSHAQTPVDVSPCDLVKQPERYGDQLVRVRGQVRLAFENFSLNTDDCGERLRWVWLSYGGDEPTPTISTVNDLERKPGSAPKLHGKPIFLQRDAALELFRKRLAAQRIGEIGDTFCYDRACYLYDVTATLTGIFLAAPGRELGGYGHLGCCHLLIIQQVAEVDARRTQVPAGGQFACSTNTWEMSRAEAQEAVKQRPCDGLRDCERATAEQLAKIAAHWSDNIDAERGETFDYPGLSRWQSPDLLRSYSLRFVFEDETGKGIPKAAIATQTLCKPVVAPYPLSTPIACAQFWSEFPVEKTDARKIQAQTVQDLETWRLGAAQDASREALEEAAHRWQVELVPNLAFRECSGPETLRGDQFTSCRWMDPNAMQSFSIQLTRFRFLRHSRQWGTVPWILTSGQGIACVAERELIRRPGSPGLARWPTNRLIAEC